MARYIDEDKLVERLKVSPIFKGFNTSGYFIRDMVIDLVECQPTADVVKVVRCKDCKHFYLDERCTLLGDFPEEPQMEPDDFCSYGEKKTEGGGADNE